jgi:FkbM family methyltransferase
VKEIHGQARILRRDAAARLQLIESRGAQFWEPALEGSAVTAQLAELAAKYPGLVGLPVKPGDVVIDCGANVGVFTRQALAQGARLVVAVEPAPINVECLRRNFASEIASGRVALCEKGAWDREDVMRLRESEETSAKDGFVIRESTRSGPLVPLTTLDKIAEELKLERVDLIKMDIEGAERRALAGAARILARHHPVLEVSVNHLPDDPEVISGVVRRGWPAYRTTCLLCEVRPKEWRIRANVLLFRP